MVPGIDPKIDYAFKRLFGKEQNAALLIDLINAILDPPPAARVVELEILNPFQPKETVNDKSPILDIKARDQSGRLLDIEMQLLAYGAFSPRVLYYWAKLYQSQLTEGMGYEELCPTISICFVNTPLFPEIVDVHLLFELRERRHAVLFTDQLQVHILELSKFNLEAAELSRPVDRWLYFLCHGQELDTEALPATLDVPPIRTALREFLMMNQSELEREHYEAQLKMQRDVRAAINFARQEGLREGIGTGRVEQLARQIQFHQRILQRAETPLDELRALPPAELAAMAEQLQGDIADRVKLQP